MKNVGFIGWRGMVGSVLMQRMVEEGDFNAIHPVFLPPRNMALKRQLMVGIAERCKMRMTSMH